MAKPSNSNPPCGNQPKSVEDTHAEHQDQRLWDRSSKGFGTKEEEIVRLQQQLTSERQKGGLFVFSGPMDVQTPNATHTNILGGLLQCHMI
jgi:hypothetical protein